MNLFRIFKDPDRNETIRLINNSQSVSELTENGDKIAKYLDINRNWSAMELIYTCFKTKINLLRKKEK